MQIKKFIFEDLAREIRGDPSDAIAENVVPKVTETHASLSNVVTPVEPENTEKEAAANDSAAADPVTPAVVLKTPEPETQTPVAPVFSEQDIQKSRSEGYENGYDKGYQAARAKDEELKGQIEATLSSIKKQLGGLESQRVTSAESYANEVQQAVLSMAKIVAQQALTENIEAKMAQLFEDYRETIFLQPSLCIFVHPNLERKVLESVESLKESSAYEGNIAVKADKTLGIGACRIDWQGGGVVFNPDIFHEKL